jgi:hypothetical protein
VASCQRSSSGGGWRSGSDTVSERAGGVVSEVTPHSPSLALGGHAKFWNLTYHTHAEPAPPLTSPYLYVALSSCPVLPGACIARRSLTYGPCRIPLAHPPTATLAARPPADIPVFVRSRGGGRGKRNISLVFGLPMLTAGELYSPEGAGSRASRIPALHTLMYVANVQRSL